MPGAYTHTARVSNAILTASQYNSDHQNHIDHMEPAYFDDYSSSLSQMRNQTDPGEVGSESQAATLAGEIERLRYAIWDAKRRYDPSLTYWYQTPGVGSLPYINVRHYGAVGNDTTDDTTAFTSALAALPSTGGTLFVPPGTYKLTGLLTLSTANTTILGSGAKLHWTAFGSSAHGSLGAGTSGIRITANNCTLRGLILYGPTVGAYVANQSLVVAVGTSRVAPLTRLTVDGCELYDVGSYGILTQFVNDITLTGNYLHNLGYAGTFLLSPVGAYVAGNHVKTISPGTVGNMYGLAFSHDSTNYNLDANAGTRVAANPFAADVQCHGNVVEDVNWEGISFHAGYSCSIVGNSVYGCKAGIAIPNSSGAALAYAGGDNRVVGNLVDANNRDGTSSGRANTAIGININGGSSVSSSHCTVSDNVVIGFGVPSNADSGAITAVYAAECTISNNVIVSWGGNAILLNNASNSMHVTGNLISALANGADTVARAVSCQSASSARLVITGNSLIAGGGTAARMGLDVPSVTTRPYVSGNNFIAATVAQVQLPSTGFTLGTDFPNRFQSVDEATPSLAGKATPGVPCVIDLAPTGPLTITNITNAFPNQIVVLVVTTSQTVTFTRANAALNGSANWAGDLNDSLTLIKVGALWTEMSRSGNNG